MALHKNGVPEGRTHIFQVYSFFFFFNDNTFSPRKGGEIVKKKVIRKRIFPFNVISKIHGASRIRFEVVLLIYT